jgi:diguanylate cyclase (GGDEF)-like protein
LVENKETGDSAAIVSGGKQTLAQRSAALVSRGLRALSGRDSSRVTSASEEDVFRELGKALTSSLQLDQVLRTIMEKIDELLRPDAWSLLLLDDSKQELHVELAVGKGSEQLKDVRVKFGQGIAGWVAERGKTLIVPDVSQDARFSSALDLGANLEARSLVAVPVRFRESCLGVIELSNSASRDGFEQRDVAVLEALADFAAIALENAGHVKRIHELTITDEATGLYNARHLGIILDTEVYRSQRYGYEFSLVCIDLESLQDLKKSLSYSLFSQLMNELGQAFKQVLRLIDFGFYYGDGEFMVLLPQTAKDDGRLIARRLHKFFRDASWLGVEGQNVRLPSRVAVAAFPEDAKTKGDLLHRLHETMYLLKKSSPDGVGAADSGILPPL